MSTAVPSQRTIYLAPDIWDQLQAIANEEATSVSAVIRRIVVRHLRTQEGK